MIAFLLLYMAYPVVSTAKKRTILVFGDSFGSVGPTWRVVRDVFAKQQVPAEVKSTAIGGTSACQWAGTDGGSGHSVPSAGPNALVDAARREFPDLSDGPDFVWFTLGSNDLAWNHTMHQCMRTSGDSEKAMSCVDAANQRILNCSTTLLNNLFEAFPKAKVMQPGYDIPCTNAACRYSFDSAFFGGYCQQDATCMTKMAIAWQQMYFSNLTLYYSSHPGYTNLNLIGTAQKAAGVEGADVGKPVIGKGANCLWEVLCVHPMYGTKAGTLWGEAMWDLYFSRHINISVEDVIV